jgi:hypothetical protein
MRFEFEYLGKFKIEFELALGYKTGAQLGSFDLKKEGESFETVPLNLL